MTQHLLTILYLALVTASITVTLSRAAIFKFFRVWLSKNSVILGKLLSCPYCLSHWVGFIVVGAYRSTLKSGPTSLGETLVSYAGTVFAVVTVTSIIIGLLFAAFQHVPPPQEETEAEAEAEEESEHA